MPLLERRTLFINFISLSLIQGTNYILPLLIFPYLVKVLGVENFGIMAFAQTIALYLMVITDYGFNLSATKDIAIIRDTDAPAITRIYNEVMTTKLVLLVLTFSFLAGLIFFIPFFRKEYFLYLCSFTIVIGQMLNPTWFFQGMEQMKYATILNVVSKGIFTILVFVFIKSPTDYWLANLLQGGGSMVAGILSQQFVIKNFNIKISIAGFEKVLSQLNKSWPVFISNFAIMACFSNNIFILGLFANKLTIGYYSIAEKNYF